MQTKSDFLKRLQLLFDCRYSDDEMNSPGAETKMFFFAEQFTITVNGIYTEWVNVEMTLNLSPWQVWS